MEEKVYICKECEMYTTSISMLFGKSPKISYLCGRCNSFNQVRLPVKAIEMNRPYTRCEWCEAINKIPIRLSKSE